MITTEQIDDGNVNAFAAIIKTRVAAEARVARAMGLAWLGAGAAIASGLAGLGIAAALYGYSYMISVKPAAEQTAKALVVALEQTRLKTTVSGTMTLASNSEVRLAAGQTVRLQEGSTVRLDPGSSVRVTLVDMPQPSSQQLGLGIKANTNELPFTSYTIFRSVPYAAGRVTTGWSFELADRAKPKFQYCYYRLNVDKGVAARYSIAVDGIPERSSGLDKADFEGALENCLWFSGS